MSHFEFSTNIEGKLYSGRYSVNREYITVSSEFGQKTIQVGNTHPKILARMILGEIVRDELRRRGLLTGPAAAPAPSYVLHR